MGSAHHHHDHAHGDLKRLAEGGVGDHDHHGHSHAHGYTAEMQGRAFAIGIVLNLGFVVGEVIYGLAANSMALLADAGHNLSDVLGLAVSWGAFRLAQRRPTPRYTYGFRASSILAALFNGVVLLVGCGALLVEAGQRLFHPAPVAGATVTIVAMIGIVVNLGTAMLFAKGAKADLNVRGAFLHMATDAAVSAGVAVAGFLTLRTGLGWIDPVTSLIVVAIILAGTWGLLREAVALAMHAVPAGIDPDKVSAALGALPGVTSVHHLHIWPMSTTETALTAHLVVASGTEDGLLKDGARLAEAGFGIAHCTFQVEHMPATGAACGTPACASG